MHSGELWLRHKLRICNTSWLCEAKIVSQTRTRLNATFILYCLSCCICSFVEMKRVLWTVISWRMWRTLNLTCTQVKYEQTNSPTSKQSSAGSSNEDGDTEALVALYKMRTAEEKSTYPSGKRDTEASHQFHKVHQGNPIRAFYSRITSTKSPSSCIRDWTASLTKRTVLFPQSHDCSCYVSTPILAPPPLWLSKHTDIRAHDFRVLSRLLGSLTLPALEAGELVEFILLNLQTGWNILDTKCLQIHLHTDTCLCPIIKPN